MKKRTIAITYTACAAAVFLSLTGLYAAESSRPAVEAISEAGMESVSESVYEAATEAETEDSYTPVQADNVLIDLPSALHQTGWQILDDGREQYQFSGDADVVNILIDSLAGYDDPSSVAASVLETDKSNYETAADNGTITILSQSDTTIDDHNAYMVLYQAPYGEGSENTLTYLTYIIDSGSSIVTVEYVYVEEAGDPLESQIIEMFNNISVE